MSKVSVIVPSRNERFLVPTVADLLTKATGDVELIVVLEGYHEHALPYADKRLKVLHHGEAKGMRPAVNAAVQIATGDYLLKVDAHTLWDEGYDQKLVADCLEDNWILVPRRYALDPEAWTIDTSNRKYPIDYHYLAEPFSRHGDSTPGLHGTAWTERRDARKDIPLDDEMSSQGSGWFMSRRYWDRLGPYDPRYGSFVHEFQELGLKAWLGGGAVKVTKRTWYAHLYKGKRYGRMYSLSGSNHAMGTEFCTWWWMTDQWPQRVHDLKWLVEKFSPVPTWPVDLDAEFAKAKATFRSPFTVAA